MVTRRQERINDLMTEELSLLVPGRLDDPRLAGVRITRVEVTQDLSTAKVYYTTAPDDDDDQVVAGLDHARGLLRAELGSLALRRLPQLLFTRDKMFESGERVLEILDHLHDAGHAEGEAADRSLSGPA